jgi:hypothetical protein
MTCAPTTTKDCGLDLCRLLTCSDKHCFASQTPSEIEKEMVSDVVKKATVREQWFTSSHHTHTHIVSRLLQPAHS